MTSLIGKTLKNRYQVVESLGRGGMAEVYKVYDSQRAVHLAMKILRQDIAQDPVFLRRFQREAKALADLQHPNIVRFFGLDRDDLLAFLLMEYVEGLSLQAEILRSAGNSLKPARMLEIMRPVCAALHYAHSQGVVHCDIKPGNILLDNNGRILLTDFGIARTLDAATSTMVGIGTPAYMAPELIKGLDPTPQTDIYALGIVLYEMATGGERPFTGETASVTGTTAEKVRWEHLKLAPVPPSTHNPHISPDLEAIIMRCLQKSPGKRFSSSIKLFQALEAALAPKPVAEIAHQDRPSPQIKAPLKSGAFNKRKPGNTPAKSEPQSSQAAQEPDRQMVSDPFDGKGVSARKVDIPDANKSEAVPIGQKACILIVLMFLVIIAFVFLGKNGFPSIGAAAATATPRPSATKKVFIPTPACSLTSALYPGWEVQQCETFSKSNPELTTGTRATDLMKQVVAIKDGKYVVDITGVAHSNYQSGVISQLPVGKSFDFLISVDGKIDSVYKHCGWGIAFRGDSEDYYLFRVQHDGFYTLELLRNGKWSTLINWRTHRGIKWDKPFNITISAEQDTMKFYIDGAQVASIDDNTLKGGGLYLVVNASEGAQAVIEFDNLLIKGP